MAPGTDASGQAGGPKQRISILTAFCMVALALALDAAQDFAIFLNALPVIGTAIDVVFSWFIAALAAIIFGVWFALLRVNYFTGKKAATKMLIMFSSVVVELIPFLDALPAITFGVVALIIQTRIEDSETLSSVLPGEIRAALPRSANDNEGRLAA